MSESANPTPESEGANANPEGASNPNPGSEGTPGAGGEGTPNEGEGNQGGEGNTPPNPDELKYSENSLSAARDAASQEARDSALRERDDAYKARRGQLAQAITEKNGHASPVIDSVAKAIRTLSADLTDQEIEPALKAVRDARNIIEEAAFVVTAQGYEAALNSTFSNEDERKAFWEKAEGLDPALDVTAVLPLYAETKALGTRAVKEADPEDLIKANPKLRAHIATQLDAKYASGREQGRKDPRGEAGAEGVPNTPARDLTREEASKTPVAELIRRRQAASARS